MLSATDYVTIGQHDAKGPSGCSRPNWGSDARTAILMREQGIARICTRGSDFNRFPFLEVIDPL